MKILIADKFDQAGRTQLADCGFDVEFQPGLSAGDLPEHLAASEPDVLIVRGTKVSAAALERTTKLSLIVRAGAGYDTIDVSAASQRGVFVANCPGQNAIAVAELAWGLILSCDRRIPDQTAALRNGEWNKKEFSKARGLYGRTLGVIGLGTIALEVVRRATAFGMEVTAWSRSLSRDRAAALGVAMAETPIDVARTADVVSVHVASTPETKGLIGEEFLSALKPGACLINTSRGAVVDEVALRHAIETRGVRAGLDVYDGEPTAPAAAFDSRIASLPGVYGTHHVGASTDQAQQAIAEEAVAVVVAFRDTGELRNCVNRAKKSPAACTLTVRHLNRPGVLAAVFEVLSERRINVEEMENILYDGAVAACAVIQLEPSASEPLLTAIQSRCADILSIEMTSR